MNEKLRKKLERFLPKDVIPLDGLMEVYKLAELYASSQDPVLIAGPSGVGKESIAHYIHNVTGTEKPFRAVNCASLEGDARMAESDIFGHKKGAYPGAQPKVGWLKDADGGTLFLDEIHHMPPLVRSKFLRVLETRELIPMGGDQKDKTNVNVRIITATNCDPDEALKPLDFRQRLLKICISIPPLRERRADIGELVKHSILTNKANETMKVEDIEPEALAYLENQDWEGNVRELQTVINRACSFANRFNAQKLDLANVIAALFLLEDGRFPSRKHILLQLGELSPKDFWLLTHGALKSADDLDNMPEETLQEAICNAASELSKYVERYVRRNPISPDPNASLNREMPPEIELPDDLYEEILNLKRYNISSESSDDSTKKSLSLYYYKTVYGYTWKDVKPLEDSVYPSEAAYRRLFKDREERHDGKGVFRGEDQKKVENHIKDYIKWKGMVPIPAGEFRMGSNDLDVQDDDADPVHLVYVDTFSIDRLVVTNEDYLKFVIANPEWDILGAKSKNFCDEDYLRHWKGSYLEGKGQHPVIYVSWFAAMAYARWLGKRLPTEAEWEKAARGELVEQKYPWGNSIDKDKANYRAKNSPIGLKLANSYGEQNEHKLYNMVGNVWEWCLDDYDPDFYAGSPKENPLAVNQKQSLKWLVDNFTNVDLDTHAVSRGGGYADWYHTLRVAQRNTNTRTLTNMSLGFRCVREGERDQ